MKGAVIVGAGSSVRFNGNKLLYVIDGKTVIERSVEAFNGIADQIILVVNSADKEIYEKMFNGKVYVVVGGSTRSQSVINGLNALSSNVDVVAVHDGARPFVTKKLIENGYLLASKYGSAIPFIKVTDTVYLDDTCLDREHIHAVQTPQTFNKEKLLNAYKQNCEATDESQIWNKVYKNLHFFDGEITNRKITYKSDVFNYVVGYGYDIHKFAENRKLYLGGEEIDYCKGLLGHSDADVVIHAIMDALLGCVNEKDIGHQFPNTDDKYKDISSMILLEKVMEILKTHNANVVNLSVAIVAESPKIAPFIEKMKNNIAKATNISPMSVSISATTAEGVGEIGNNQAIACRCVALVTKQ